MSRHAVAAFAIAAALIVAGCSSKEKRSVFDVEFAAHSDDGQPLAGVVITANGNPLGTTQADGVLRTVLRARPGSMLRPRATCPEGYREPVQPAPLRLRNFRTLEVGKDDKLRVSIECRASERMVALVVNTDQRADLPVMMEGHEIGRTNAEGVAHVALRMAPNSTFRVALDTSQQAKLRPRNPIATFTVGDADSLVLFDQAFVEEVKKKKHHRRRKKPKPKPEDPRPTKIVGPDRTWRHVGR